MLVKWIMGTLFLLAADLGGEWMWDNRPEAVQMAMREVNILLGLEQPKQVMVARND